jgi:hypothetical protein
VKETVVLVQWMWVLAVKMVLELVARSGMAAYSMRAAVSLALCGAHLPYPG